MTRNDKSQSSSLNPQSSIPNHRSPLTIHQPGWWIVGGALLVGVVFFLIWERQWVAGRPTIAPTYTNPVLKRAFPQPSILAALTDYWAFSAAPPTAGETKVNVRALRSADLIQWTDGGEVLPTVGVWATPGSVRSVDVMPGPRRGYILYYTAVDKASGRACISLATSEKPTGPYDDTRETPLVCGATGVGDPYAFIDEGGAMYLLWTETSRQPATIFIQRLNRDGLGLIDEAKALLTADQLWEKGVLSAPTLIKRASRYFLLYTSAGGIGYASGDSAQGPLTKAGAPLLAGRDPAATTSACVPGGQAVILDAVGQDWLVYETCSRGSLDDGRSTSPAPILEQGIRMDRLVVEGGRLSVAVIDGPQVAPSLRR